MDKIDREVKLKKAIEEAVFVMMDPGVPRESIANYISYYILGLLNIGKKDLMKGIK